MQIKEYIYNFIQSQNICIDADVFDYGYLITKKYLIFILITLPVVIIQQSFVEFIIYLVVFISLRQNLGGFHFDNSNICMFFSIISAIFIMFINQSISDINLVARIFILLSTFICINKIGVLDHKNKRLTDYEKSMFTKKANIILLFYSIIGIFIYSLQPSFVNVMFLTLIFMDLNMLSSILLALFRK